MPRCEHEYIERERGREEPELVEDDFREVVCVRCDDYQVVPVRDDRREVKGGEES